MNAIVNLGKPLKDLATTVGALFPTGFTRSSLKITGAEVFEGTEFLLTSPMYGAGMVLDCLEELWAGGLLESGENIFFVGSMGSLCASISLGQIVLPNPAVCAYYGFNRREVEQADSMLTSAKTILVSEGHEVTAYRHGSSFAVFDPHTNHDTYKSTLYDECVLGVDCGEVFVGLDFAIKRRLSAGAVLYCSDSPTNRIGDIEERDFDRMAAENDLLLNRVAAQAVSAH